ncbi:MAG: type II toxin-antitoxin system RelE/ParE family toxin [Coriobacteriia bacterium]|nr:type II toxin-antitoxin system RelE/ParE family toxin [Coriobacteriia bacterium]
MAASCRRTILFTPAAADDLDAAFAYVSERDRTAAAALLARLQDTVQHLADFPEMGVALSHEDFELIAPGVRFVVEEPYLVFYRVTDTAVVVLRILHSRRDSLGELLG